jgi:hypothetical protein
MWWPSRARAVAVWGAVLAMGAAAVVVSGLGRASEIPDGPGRGGEAAGHVTGAVPDGFVLGRILERDLPPTVGYVAGVAAVLFAAVAAMLTLRRRGQATGRGSPMWRGIAVGVVVTAAVIPAVVAGGGAARSMADRRAESDSLLHEIMRPAERLAVAPGPAEPSTQRWRVDWVERYGIELQFSGVVAVPGWDVMVGYVRSPSSVVAFSKTDGSELWRYGRRDGLIGGITVDPEAGRVLVLSGSSALVLGIEDGSELLARQLPFTMDAPGVTSGGGQLVGARYTDGPGDKGPIVATGSAAVVAAYPTLAVIDVSSGELVGSATESPSECNRTRYAAASSTPSPVIVEWGLSIGGGECGNPTLLAVGDDGRIEPVAEIPPPSDRSIAQGCYAFDCGTLMVAGDTIVLLNQWATTSGSVAAEFVAVSRRGEIRWREPVDHTADLPALVAVTESGVITQSEEEWRLLSLTDGTELARRPTREERSEGSTTDGERLYTAGIDGLIVRSVDDLVVVGTSDPFPRLERMFAGSGVLVVLDDSGNLVGYTDGPATGGTPAG